MKNVQEIREGLKRCKLNSPIWCGNCPYVKLRELDNDISKCTSALCKDAEALIDRLMSNHLHVRGLDE